MPELSDHASTEARSISPATAGPGPDPAAAVVTAESSPPTTPGSAAETALGSPVGTPVGDVAAAGSPRPRGKAPAQWAFRPRASLTMRIGMAMFALGVLAIVVIMVLFASGSHDLPLWLNLTAMLAPLGFAVGMVGVAVAARRSSRALASSAADSESRP